MRLLFESFKPMVLEIHNNLHYKDHHNVTVTNLTKLDHFVTMKKALTLKTVIESFKNPSLTGSFGTICDLEHMIFRSIFASGEVTSLHSQISKAT
jgi:superoxide dismutase